MGILNPVISKFSLTAGVPQEIYSCPVSKSHAIVDLSFFKDELSSDCILMVALTTKDDPSTLTSIDYFIDDIELIGNVNSAELSKIIIGAGERLYIHVLSGPTISVRLSGVEEVNPAVLKAGRLASVSIGNTDQAIIFENNIPNTSYTTCTITIYNSSAMDLAEIEGWITSTENPTSTDKVMRIKVPTEDTTIIENILLVPNEKIIFKSSQVNTEYFVTGVVVGGVF